MDTGPSTVAVRRISRWTLRTCRWILTGRWDHQQRWPWHGAAKAILGAEQALTDCQALHIKPKYPVLCLAPRLSETEALRRCHCGLHLATSRPARRSVCALRPWHGKAHEGRCTGRRRRYSGGAVNQARHRRSHGQAWDHTARHPIGTAAARPVTSHALAGAVALPLWRRTPCENSAMSLWSIARSH